MKRFLRLDLLSQGTSLRCPYEIASTQCGASASAQLRNQALPVARVVICNSSFSVVVVGSHGTTSL